MAERFGSIDKFVKQVRERLNQHFWLDILIRCMCVAGVVLIIVGLSYILRGYHVPLFWYPAVLFLAVIVTSGLWLFFRRSFDDAAIHTDKHFKLKDAVCSYKGFSNAHKQGGIYDLQAGHTKTELEKVSVTDVRYEWPARTIGLCIVLMFSSGLLALKADNPKIAQRRQTAEQMLLDTEQINEQIKDTLEQIKEQAKKDDIEKLVAPDKLQAMVDELKKTPDLKDAMRQYARLEKKLNDVLSKLQQRKDEQLYEKMGKVLQKHERAKALGNRLTKKQYKEAAIELQKFKIDKKSPIENQRKQLEQLKSISERMANEARQNKSSSNAAKLAKRLDKAASNLGKALNSPGKGSGSQNPKGSQQSSQSSSSQGSSSQSSSSQGSSSQGSGSQGSGSGGAEGVNESLSEMAENLNNLDAKCKAQSAIQKLCESLSQCQGKLSGKSGSGSGKGNGNGDGSGQGGGIGSGSSSNTNANINNSPATGDKSVLKGIKGQGPSVNTTEAASDGSGSSSDSKARLIEQYKHQAESFIRREDVSEAVKSGVKEYFENIHRIEEGK
ncbi:MAG: hypothetical protein IIB56_06245 [Planctomycetes bacterium]|nr:hypothetical protein [Planctomycetota bacterium]MCH8118320.1 hypothetical protein [Planctomycetota bacterium]